MNDLWCDVNPSKSWGETAVGKSAMSKVDNQSSRPKLVSLYTLFARCLKFFLDKLMNIDEKNCASLDVFFSAACHNFEEF